jgi:hypothetical protein
MERDMIPNFYIYIASPEILPNNLQLVIPDTGANNNPLSLSERSTEENL